MLSRLTYTEKQYKKFMTLRHHGVPVREAARRARVRFWTAQAWSSKRGSAACMVNYHNLHKIPNRSRRMTTLKGYLMGVLCGDGWIGSKRKTIQLGVTDEDFARRFARSVSKQYAKDVRVRCSRRRNKTWNPVYRVRFESKEIHADLFREFDGILPICESWRVPKTIKQSLRAVKMEFVRGVVDSEGTFHRGRGTVHIVLKNKHAIRDLADLMFEFRIQNNIYKVHYSQQNCDYWMLRIPRVAVPKFQRICGFTIKRKVTAIKKFFGRKAV